MPIAILYYKVTPESISSAQQSAQIVDWIKKLPLASLKLQKTAISQYSKYAFSLDQLQLSRVINWYKNTIRTPLCKIE